MPKVLLGRMPLKFGARFGRTPQKFGARFGRAQFKFGARFEWASLKFGARFGQALFIFRARFGRTPFKFGARFGRRGLFFCRVVWRTYWGNHFPASFKQFPLRQSFWFLVRLCFLQPSLPTRRMVVQRALACMWVRDTPTSFLVYCL